LKSRRSFTDPEDVVKINDEFEIIFMLTPMRKKSSLPWSPVRADNAESKGSIVAKLFLIW
jgi:hypothetical protein